MKFWDAIVDAVDNIRDTVESFPAIMRDPPSVILSPVRVPKLPHVPPSTSRLPKGAVIKVTRYAGDVVPVYDHYGIYISESSVIHYNNPEKGAETSGDNRVIETTLREFMARADEVQEVRFSTSEFEGRRHTTYVPGIIARPPELPKVLSPNAHLFKQFTPDEIEARARSRLGNGGYSLVFNNCEHFAVWCATGVSESEQVRRFFSGSWTVPVRL